jgi:cation diffusion facilitator CzcD-associated flavoprotein CzcO
VSGAHVDLLIVGAGLSGVGVAHQFAKAFPGKSYAILEQRDELGGTWSLFKYPGIRSDSDMHTMGYRFKPWTSVKSIAPGSAILDYVRETAREGGVDAHITYGRKVVRAEWSTDDARWTVDVLDVATGTTGQRTCGFLFLCSGYFRYDQAYRPHFDGEERFGGPIVHPQFWPADLDYAGKRVVVIGSGATAITLVPAMAATAAHVTMLQRSPTYVVPLPGEDTLAIRLRKRLPLRVASEIIRWKNVIRVLISFQLSRRRPHLVKGLIRKVVKAELPPDYDMRHFTPAYNPWDQRLCVAPDGDLFQAIRDGRATVVTDKVECLTETGIRLASGDDLDADIIVTATGLELVPLGGITFVVDGQEVELPKTMAYRAIMLSDVPNMAFALGYTNSSWTLKVDLTYEYVFRLLKRLDRLGLRQCTPRRDPSVEEAPFMDFTSGYVVRAIDKYYKAGSRKPWRLSMNYAYDLVALRFGSIEDGVMELGNPQPSKQKSAAA